MGKPLVPVGPTLLVHLGHPTSLAVGLFYTCILLGARQVQGPCCTNPNPIDGVGCFLLQIDSLVSHVNYQLYYITCKCTS